MKCHIQMMHYKFVKSYIQRIEREYDKWKIKMNYRKTEIILNTKNPAITEYIGGNFEMFKYNFEGNVMFLGVAHGQDRFIVDAVNEVYMRLQRKILQIELLNNRFLKFKMYKRFLDYNKIIYIIKTTRCVEECVNNLESIYQFIKRSITAYITYTPTMEFQLHLTQRRGGLGLRNPKTFRPATRITSVFGKSDKVERYFNFSRENEFYDETLIFDNQNYVSIFNNTKWKFEQELQNLV